MKEILLVAYASKYGSTREVAEAIAASLRDCGQEHGLEVDLQLARKVRTLEGYSAVVLGAPLYFGMWHKDALHFLSQHRETLLNRPAAIFALGPSHADEVEWQASRAMLEKELAKVPWLKPTAVEIFGGKFDPARLRFPDNLIASLPASPLHGMPASDARDWASIRAWAGSLAGKLAWSGRDEQPVFSQ